MVGKQAAIIEQEDSTVLQRLTPMPSQVTSDFVQLVVTITCTRIMEVAQTLFSK